MRCALPCLARLAPPDLPAVCCLLQAWKALLGVISSRLSSCTFGRVSLDLAASNVTERVTLGCGLAELDT